MIGLSQDYFGAIYFLNLDEPSGSMQDGNNTALSVGDNNYACSVLNIAQGVTDADGKLCYTFPPVAITVAQRILLPVNMPAATDFTWVGMFKFGTNNKFRNWLMDHQNASASTNGDISVGTLSSSGNKLFAQVYNGSAYGSKISAQTLTAGTWYRLGARKQGLNIDLFVDMVKESGTGVVPAGFVGASNPHMIGARILANPYYSCDGNGRKFGFWPFALTDDQIINLQLRM